MFRKVLQSALFLVIAVLTLAPALQACEDCWPANVKDPSGGTSDKVRCYTHNSGMWEICTVKQDYSGCNLDDTDPTACPSGPDEGGSGGSGGTGTGTGGSLCSTRITGACPPDCANCGGSPQLY